MKKNRDFFSSDEKNAEKIAADFFIRRKKMRKKIDAILTFRLASSRAQTADGARQRIFARRVGRFGDGERAQRVLRGGRVHQRVERRQRVADMARLQRAGRRGGHQRRKVLLLLHAGRRLAAQTR